MTHFSRARPLCDAEAVASESQQNNDETESSKTVNIVTKTETSGIQRINDETIQNLRPHSSVLGLWKEMFSKSRTDDKNADQKLLEKKSTMWILSFMITRDFKKFLMFIIITLAIIGMIVYEINSFVKLNSSTGKKTGNDTEWFSWLFGFNTDTTSEEDQSWCNQYKDNLVLAFCSSLVSWICVYIDILFALFYQPFFKLHNDTFEEKIEKLIRMKKKEGITDNRNSKLRYIESLGENLEYSLLFDERAPIDLLASNYLKSLAAKFKIENESQVKKSLERTKTSVRTFATILTGILLITELLFVILENASAVPYINMDAYLQGDAGDLWKLRQVSRPVIYYIAFSFAKCFSSIASIKFMDSRMKKQFNEAERRITEWTTEDQLDSDKVEVREKKIHRESDTNTFLEMGFFKTILTYLTGQAILMLIEFFFVEMMVTDWEGEHLLSNPWIGINNVVLLLSSFVAVKHSIDFIAINSGHEDLIGKMRSIGRQTIFGNVDGSMYHVSKSQMDQNCTGQFLRW